MNINQVFFKSSKSMVEVDDNSVSLIVTSPPYFNIKEYDKNGRQDARHSIKNYSEIGNTNDYDFYINEMLEVWKECVRVLEPNGKLIINTPLLPMVKKKYSTHYNRDIFDINSDIQSSIKALDDIHLMDIYIWNRTNSTKNLMFGSYPYPSNFYAQNTSEFITVYVKGGKPKKRDRIIKEKSKLTKDEWLNFTQQIWNIPIPNKKDLAFGEHSAIMPEEIVKRCVKMYSFYGDIVLDPFTGSGTTLKIAKNLGRNYIGYELYHNYENIINLKLNEK